MISRTWGYFLLAFSVVLVSGCSWFYRPSSLPRSYSIPCGEPASTYISKRIMLVADNQLHNIYGEPVRILRTGLADKIVQTSIRPVQLDFYGQDFLTWFVENSFDPFVHVGDACDLSCTGEFTRFWNIMHKAKKGWVMAPGNHDGYFFGNDHRSVDKGDWPAACMNAGKPMTKDVFVRLYLAALVLQQRSDRPGYQSFARELELDQMEHVDLEHVSCAILNKGLKWGTWRYDAEGRHFLHGVSWKIDEERPWRSFIVQEVDLTLDTSKLPSIRAIILDTVQYNEAPQLLPSPPSVNAGLTGELCHDQYTIVKDWIESNTDKDRIWVLIGHHPFDSLTKEAQEAVDDLRRRTSALCYVSAHTHAGQFIVHGSDKDEDKWLELNIGSLLDWSLEFRGLQIERTKKDERLVLRSPRYTMHERLHTLMNLPINDEEWEAKQGDADYYLGHENLKHLDAYKTEIHLKNALLATYHRLIRLNPTKADDHDVPWPSCCQSDRAILSEIDHVMKGDRLDKKIKLLVELDRFEQGRHVEDPDMHQKFRLSQALWASKYDSVHSRKPLKDNWFIIFPPEHK